jgi:hypothetical protein
LVILIMEQQSHPYYQRPIETRAHFGIDQFPTPVDA